MVTMMRLCISVIIFTFLLLSLILDCIPSTQIVSSPKDDQGKSIYPSLNNLLSDPPSYIAITSDERTIENQNHNNGASYSHNPAYYEEEIEEQDIQASEQVFVNCIIL